MSKHIYLRLVKLHGGTLRMSGPNEEQLDEVERVVRQLDSDWNDSFTALEQHRDELMAQLAKEDEIDVILLCRTVMLRCGYTMVVTGRSEEVLDEKERLLRAADEHHHEHLQWVCSMLDTTEAERSAAQAEVVRLKSLAARLATEQTEALELARVRGEGLEELAQSHEEYKAECDKMHSEWHQLSIQYARLNDNYHDLRRHAHAVEKCLERSSEDKKKLEVVNAELRAKLDEANERVGALTLHCLGQVVNGLR